MEQIRINDLLQEHRLKRTKFRIAPLNFLLSARHARSYSEIKLALGDNVDKSSLYKNLSAFEEVGIIHRIDHSGFTKYALGKAQKQVLNHAHFVCEQCETVYCMEELSPMQFKIPKGFKANRIQAIIKGVCAAC